MVEESNVITSYSIHYTKLYDLKNGMCGTKNRRVDTYSEGVNEMKIEVYENVGVSKLVAMLVGDDGTERELVRSDKGNDDLLNKIDDMGLSHLTVTFNRASAKK